MQQSQRIVVVRIAVKRTLTFFLFHHSGSSHCIHIAVAPGLFVQTPRPRSFPPTVHILSNLPVAFSLKTFASASLTFIPVELGRHLVVVVAVLAVSALAEDVAVQIGLGGVLRNDDAGVVDLSDDIVFNRIPQIVDGSHGL
jgi:hypothetical protein